MSSKRLGLRSCRARSWRASVTSRERADIAKDRLERAFGHLAEIVHAERAAEVAEKANRCNVGRFEDCEASYGLTG
jgi:hypothetical protein